MSLLDDPNLQTTTHTKFTGPNLLVDADDDAQDVEYVLGHVRTRRGFDIAFYPSSSAPGRAISTMINWFTARFQRLVYFSPATQTLYQRNLLLTSTDPAAETTIVATVTPSALGAVHSQAGYRLITAFFRADSSTNDIVPVGPGYIWNGLESEKLFPRPLLATDVASWIFTEPSTGVVTAGRHYYGLLLVSKNGAETRPGPAGIADLQFDYLVAPTHVATGGANLNMAITATWPTWAAQAWPIMTPVDNPNRWFKVPTPDGLPYGVPGGSSFLLNITLDLSDVTLTGTSDTDLIEDGQFDILSQDASGDGPVSPYLTTAFGRRTVYAIEDLAPDGASLTSALLISDPSQPQRLSRAYHLIYLPEFRQISTMFTIGTTLYVLGPGWTYAFSDNGGYPTQWVEPRRVSGSIGSRFPYGFAANDALNYAWVANSAGLYRLESGIYPDLPASYNQTPVWRQINFHASPESLKVVEDSARRLVMVAAPVGEGQIVPNRILVWDFTQGTHPDRIRYCGAWIIQQGDYDPGAIAMVNNPQANRLETWLGRALVAGPVLRQKYDPQDGLDGFDPDLYSDDGIGIQSRYRFSSLWELQTGPALFVALAIRIRGIGQTILKIFSLDQTNEQTLPGVDLSPVTGTAPSRLWTRFINKQTESASLEISSSGQPGTFFLLSMVKIWWARWMTFR